MVNKRKIEKRKKRAVETCAHTTKKITCQRAVRSAVRTAHAYPPAGGRHKHKGKKRSSKGKRYTFTEPHVPVTSGYEIMAYQ